jgi:outer membrane protein assembly factor BamB/tetratricopeptide (TPR) repeat protein
MPSEGLEFYRLNQRASSKQLLDKARAESDPTILADVAKRYLYTEAGAEAANLLGTYYLERGQHIPAALMFERLINREGADNLSPATLIKAALAFRRTGDRAKEENAWNQLTEKHGDRIKLGNRTLAVNDLRDDVEKNFKTLVAAASLYDWSMYGGNPTRSSTANGGTPFLEKRWYLPVIREDATKKLILERTVRTMETRNQPVLPTFFPIAADGKLVYRSFWGVHAVDLRTGKLMWEAPGELTLDRIHDTRRPLPWKGAMVNALNGWVQQYTQTGKMNILFENSMLGTLTTDNQQVYLVDDVAMPPWMGYNPNDGSMGRLPNLGDPKLNGMLQHNRLQAYDLKSGKLRWELGGFGDKKDAGVNDLNDTYFLGPPLPMHGKLYVLAEKQQELSLVCLDAAKGEVTWRQKLAEARDKIVQDVTRRTQAAHLAYGEGILVCPTNAGAVLGVDLLSQSLVWAHSYRDKATTNQAYNPNLGFNPGMAMQMNLNSEWKTSAPVVTDGKVVFAAPDGSAVHCLNLRDGSLVWKSGRAEDDLYLAGVFKGRAVVVGKKTSRAYDLKDGKLAWTVDTGMPSGQGVASEGIYYLPLKAALATKEPEVCAIDIEKGIVHAHTRSRKKEVPGNLLFYEGDVISQGLTEVVAFPQLEVKLKLVDAKLGKDSRDPEGLTERADLRLDAGNLQGAVDDLRTALAVIKDKPEDERKKLDGLVHLAKIKLHDTLTEFLQRDFDRGEKFIDEYKALCKVEDAAETKRRTANFLCLLAKGKETQGKLTEAFDAYMEFGSLGAENKELMTVIDEPSVKAPADVWAQGRIAAMMAKAKDKPELAQPLEDRLAKRWTEVEKSSDAEDLRRFVTMFGQHFKVGREARIALAERMMSDTGTGTLLEAERQLLLLSTNEEDPKLAGRAVEALARLMARKGFLEDAAHYYRVLGTRFAKVEVRDGKTGEDFYNDLATDKRFLPYLDEPAQVWGNTTLKGKEVNGVFNQTRQAFAFEASGEVVPFFKKHKISLDFNYHAVKVHDRATGEEKWSSNLTRTQFQQFLYTGNPNQQPTFPFYSIGHVVVLNLGHMVFGLDPVNKRVLWEQNLLGASGLQQHNNIMVDPKDGTLQIFYQDGWVQRIGQALPIQPGYVCLQTRDGLIAIDPINGKTLWTRNDVTTRAHLFGDGGHVFVVDVNNDGTPTSTRAFRAHDGVTVKGLGDFTSLYRNRVRIMGRKILATEAARGKFVLRQYDVLKGKDDWTKEFAANSVMMRSEVPNLAGVYEPDGKVTVFDLHTEKEVLKGQIDPKHLEKAQYVTLLQDRDRYYCAINGPLDAETAPWGGVQSNLLQGSGLRSFPVNGQVYAFDRETQKIKWRADAYNQMLVMESFNDLPVMIFTSRYHKMVGAGAAKFPQQVVEVRSIDKRTGKLVFDKPGLSPNLQQFYQMNTNMREGTIELVSYNYKVILAPEGK